MRKLKLQPDDLTVESFTPSRGDAERGTAHAYGDGAAIPVAPLDEGAEEAATVSCGMCSYDVRGTCYPYC